MQVHVSKADKLWVSDITAILLHHDLWLEAVSEEKQEPAREGQPWPWDPLFRTCPMIAKCDEQAIQDENCANVTCF